MTDTQRSLATLASLLADNSLGAISAQDLRDAVLATIQPGYAEMYISGSSATTLGDTSTWVQVGGTYTLTDSSSNWTMGVNGQLLYGGTEDREVQLWATASLTSAGTNDQLQFAFAKDGAVLTPSIVQRYVTTGTDVGALAIIGHTDVSSGEYLSLVTRNISAAADTTALFATVLLVDFAA